MTTVCRPQHLVALELANEVRFARARLKRDLRAGVVSVGDALALDCAQGMRLSDVLAAQRGWGACRAQKVLAVVGVGEGKRVGALTPRQLGVVRSVLA